MGGCLCGRKRDGRILLLGLSDGGKTTIVRRLRVGGGEMSPPGQTVGFNVENVYYKNKEYRVWDVSGKDKVRPLWNRYFSDTLALIWVVDSSDEESLQLSKQELHRVLHEPELRDAVILIYLNKQDLRNALSPIEIVTKLDLNETLKRRKWFLQPCSGKKNEGVMEGFAWLAVNL